MPNPLLTFSSLRPKFSPLVSTTTRSTCPTQPLPRDPPLCLFPCERVVPLPRVQETCFPCIQTWVRAAGGGVHVVKSASEAAPARHRGRDGRTAPLRSGPDRPSAAAQSTPDRPGATTSQPTCARSPTSDRWATVLSVKNVTGVTLGPRS